MLAPHFLRHPVIERILPGNFQCLLCQLGEKRRGDTGGEGIAGADAVGGVCRKNVRCQHFRTAAATLELAVEQIDFSRPEGIEPVAVVIEDEVHLLDAVCDQRPKDDRAAAGVLGCQLLDELDTNGALVPRLCRSDGNRVAEVQIAAGNVVEQIVGCCDSKPFQCGSAFSADTIEVGNGLK